MKNSYLLPNYFKKIGVITTLIFALLFYKVEFDNFQFKCLDTHHNNNLTFPAQSNLPKHYIFNYNENENWSNELADIGLVVSLLLIAFSKEKKEDEYIQAIRLKSWQIAGISFYLVFIFIELTVFGGVFLTMLTLFPLGLIPLYIVVFYFQLKRLQFFQNKISAE